MGQANKRNFSIIAHIDHGKSTLSDCLIQRCGGLTQREMKAQVLDQLAIERERGITIKAQSVTLNYRAKDGQDYQLNFIDTPGHVDFSYEVSRSLASCEGALLVVDAAQSVEAQTLAVCYAAVEQDLTIIPVLNKIDLPQADCRRVKEDIEQIIGIDCDQAIEVSAKSQIGIDDLLEALIHQIPAPTGKDNLPLQALIIDSWFDNYLGVVSLIRVVNGSIKKGDHITILSTQERHQVDQVGIHTPKRQMLDALQTGEVGYMVAGIKNIHGAPVGDTITHTDKPCQKPLPGFDKIKPQVYAGLFPIQSDDYLAFKDALYKLMLNDSSIEVEPEHSDALGIGFRCGFLGMLHMEIVQERLEREYHLDLISTAPTVVYRIELKQGTTIDIDSPTQLPDPNAIKAIHEPIAQVNMLTPPDYLGNVISLCIERRGIQKNIEYVGKQVALTFDIPMNEIVLDFFDKLKSTSRGFASLDYHFKCFNEDNLVKVDYLINGEKVDALANIVHKSAAMTHGRKICEKLKSLIPRQMFPIAIQAAIGGHIIARTTVSALRKNVTAKCYGGDISRKKKLLEKQKAGKKRMKQVGKVHIPQDAFLAVLKTHDDK